MKIQNYQKSFNTILSYCRKVQQAFNWQITVIVVIIISLLFSLSFPLASYVYTRRKSLNAANNYVRHFKILSSLFSINHEFNYDISYIIKYFNLHSALFNNNIPTDYQNGRDRIGYNKNITSNYDLNQMFYSGPDSLLSKAQVNNDRLSLLNSYVKNVYFISGILQNLQNTKIIKVINEKNQGGSFLFMGGSLASAFRQFGIMEPEFLSNIERFINFFNFDFSQYKTDELINKINDSDCKSSIYSSANDFNYLYCFSFGNNNEFSLSPITNFSQLGNTYRNGDGSDLGSPTYNLKNLNEYIPGEVFGKYRTMLFSAGVMLNNMFKQYTGKYIGDLIGRSLKIFFGSEVKINVDGTLLAAAFKIALDDILSIPKIRSAFGSLIALLVLTITGVDLSGNDGFKFKLESIFKWFVNVGDVISDKHKLIKGLKDAADAIDNKLDGIMNSVRSVFAFLSDLVLSKQPNSDSGENDLSYPLVLLIQLMYYQLPFSDLFRHSLVDLVEDNYFRLNNNSYFIFIKYIYNAINSILNNDGDKIISSFYVGNVIKTLKRISLAPVIGTASDEYSFFYLYLKRLKELLIMFNNNSISKTDIKEAITAMGGKPNNIDFESNSAFPLIRDAVVSSGNNRLGLSHLIEDILHVIEYDVSQNNSKNIFFKNVLDDALMNMSNIDGISDKDLIFVSRKNNIYKFKLTLNLRSNIINVYDRKETNDYIFVYYLFINSQLINDSDFPLLSDGKLRSVFVNYLS